MVEVNLGRWDRRQAAWRGLSVSGVPVVGRGVVRTARADRPVVVCGFEGASGLAGRSRENLCEREGDLGGGGEGAGEGGSARLDGSWDVYGLRLQVRCRRLTA